MQEAAESKNGEKLAGHVNFPRLREALKARLNSKLSARVSKEAQTHPLSGLSTALVAKMVDPLIEKMVTPNSLMAVFNGNTSALPLGRPQRKEQDPGKNGEEAKSQESIQEVSMSYESFNRFTASVKKRDSNDAPITLLMQREGIASWKLIDIDFPL